MPMFDRLHTDPVYNTRAVAQKTGVPADTFRAWERRYQLPNPGRSIGNQRLYCERDVAIISWLRDQTRAGMTISHAVALFHTLERATPPDEADSPGHSALEQRGHDEERLRLNAIEVSRPDSSPFPRASFFQTCNALMDALCRFDSAAAERILEDLIAVSSVETVCHEVFRPTTQEFRHRREQGIVPPCVERFAHAFMQRKVNALFNQSRPETGRGPVLAAGVEGDHDELELLYHSLFLSRNGFAVVYLGSDTPVSEIKFAMESLDPKMVLLNASNESTTKTLDHSIRSLHAHPFNGGMPVIGFTGEIFERAPELRASINATYLGNDGHHVVANCDRLLQSLPAHR